LDYSKFNNNDTIYLSVLSKPDFSASITSSTPSDVYPGDTASLLLNIQNNSSGKAQSARISITNAKGLEIKWAGQTQELGQINGFSKTSVPVEIEALKGLSPGEYDLNLTISYIDETNTQNVQSIILPVTISPKADFEITQTESQELISSNTTLVRLTLKNTGTASAEKVKAKVMPTFPFSSDGTVRYIENLPVGGSYEIDYTITTDNSATAGKELLSVIVNYQNEKQKDFSSTVDFYIPVRDKNILDSVIENVWIVGLLIVIIVFAIIMRKRGQKKK